MPGDEDWESRWSSFRIPLQTVTLGLVIVGLGALRATDDFDGPAASTVPVTDAGFALEATGDLSGTGRWRFEQVGPEVVITYDWRVSATKPLLRRLSWLLRPAFSANHHWAMAKGEESLKLELRRRRAQGPEAEPVPPRRQPRSAAPSTDAPEGSRATPLPAKGGVKVRHRAATGLAPPRGDPTRPRRPHSSRSGSVLADPRKAARKRVSGEERDSDVEPWFLNH